MGFPLDISYSQDFEPKTVIANHSTATQHSECIQKYLAVETQHKAIMGPFKISPISALHCSPKLTRPKTGSTNRRVIGDLSWPHGNSENDNVCKDSYMGTLLYIHKCVRPARLFVNRILATLRESPESGHTSLPPAFHRDIAWFNTFLPVFNGQVYLKKNTYSLLF